MRRWWTGEKLSVRLFEVAFVLVLTGALVWAGWFASDSQNATWTPVLVSIVVVGAVASGKRRSRTYARLTCGLQDLIMAEPIPIPGRSRIHHPA